MSQSAITLENEVRRPARRSESFPSPSPVLRAADMKFVHANGSKPLDGYTIQRGLGAGGFGEVYFAVSDAGKEVALKRIQRNLDVEVRGVRQCLNLKHPNLVAIYDIKYDPHGDAWVVMEFVAGECLRDVIARHPDGMPTKSVNAWLQGIGAGVAYLHQSGIVHRDLKPANIFSDLGMVKIGDYGLSKFISCSQRSGQTDSVGTFHYMAPEIGRGSYGREIDIYALGIILFEMLTGRLPFDGETSQEIIMKHLTATPDLSGLPDAYRDVVKTALQKEPVKRFSRVEEILESLHLPLGPKIVGALDPQVVVQMPAVLDCSEPAPARGNAIPPHESTTTQASAAASPTAGEVVLAETIAKDESPFGDEPIAKMVRNSWQRACGRWNRSPEARVWRAVFLSGGVLLFVMNFAWLVPLMFIAVAMYVIYFGLRALLLTLASSTTPANNSPAAPSQQTLNPGGTSSRGAGSHNVPRSTFVSAEVLRANLAQLPIFERTRSFVASLLTSSFVVLVMSLVMMILGGQSLDTSISTWSFYAWFALTAVAGTWLVTFFGKIWEPKEGDEMLRRFVMLVSGLALGAFSYELAQFLTVSIDDSWPLRSAVSSTSNFYDSYGRPKLPAFLAYFGAPLVLLRWWKQADPFRPTRVSLWDAAICAGCGGLIHLVWPFGQPWGMMVLATISIAVQLSTPWVSKEDRRLDLQRKNLV